MRRAGSMTLSDFAGRRIAVECIRCGRMASYSADRLLAGRGDARLTDFLEDLTRDCPHKASRALHERCGEIAREDASRPFVLIGDFNTGDNALDRSERAVRFHCEPEFHALASAGLRDLWREQNGCDAREFTWLSTSGNGFRIDHAFGNAKVATKDCRYDHSTRIGRLTDHSALIARLEVRD